MTETTITASEAATLLGVANAANANRTLRRLGVRPTGRQTGQGGENIYDRAEVTAEQARRVGQGARTEMFTATHQGTTYRFRSLNGLTRQLGGTSWQACHSEAFEPPTREVHILTKAYRNPGAFNIVATVWVPSEAVTSARSDATDYED